MTARARTIHPRPTRQRIPVPSGAAGVFTRASALAEGWTDSALRHAVSTGRLVRIHRGLLAVPGDLDRPGLDARDIELTQRAHAAALTCPRAVLSHCAAALTWQLPLVQRPTRPCLTVPAGTALRDLEDVHLHRAGVPEHHVVRQEGFAVLTPARTVFDLAREHGTLAGVVAADAALHRGLATLDQLGEVVEFCRRWPGRARCRAVIARCDGLAESPLESISREAMRRLGLSRPVLQAEIGDEHGRFVTRTDFYWPEFGVVGEADGAAKYSTAAVIRSERQSEAIMRDLGLIVVRWGWHDALRFEVTAHRLRASFDRGTPARDGHWTLLNPAPRPSLYP